MNMQTPILGRSPMGEWSLSVGEEPIYQLSITTFTNTEGGLDFKYEFFIIEKKRPILLMSKLKFKFTKDKIAVHQNPTVAEAWAEDVMGNDKVRIMSAVEDELESELIDRWEAMIKLKLFIPQTSY